MSAKPQIGRLMAKSGGRWRSGLPIALIAGLALALMLPALIGPTQLNDSHINNLIWADQFTSEMRSGKVWPRWLPGSYDGLGAPVFYFYGPVAFWVSGLLGLAGVPVWPALMLTGAIALAASGIGMLLLIRSMGGSRALAGAAFFVIAPYHLLDILRRGALAEFVAVAILPWFALALRRAGKGRIAPLAIAYAALILTHLPTALLCSVFLLPLLMVDQRPFDRTALSRIGAGLAIGAGLSAIYWLPALLLQRWVNMAAMRTPAMIPANWRPASFLTDFNPALVLLMAIACALALPALLFRGRWGLAALVMLSLAIGLFWPVWLMPPLDRIQFPWRILSLAELAIAIAIGKSRIEGIRLLAVMAPALILSALILAPSIASIGTEQPTVRIADLLKHHPDVGEYQPRGVTNIPHSTGWTEHVRDGATTVRRFAFPIWRARCPWGMSQTFASAEGYLQYSGTGCTIEQHAPFAEQIGSAVSLFALALLIACQFHASTRIPR